jgi:hypothetical protein
MLDCGRRMLLRGQKERVSIRKILIGADGGTLAAQAARLGIKLCPRRRLLVGLGSLLPQTYSPVEFMQVGKPASEIVGIAEGWSADMIVIGSHGRHGIQRALLGSVCRSCPAACALFGAYCTRGEQITERLFGTTTDSDCRRTPRRISEAHF